MNLKFVEVRDVVAMCVKYKVRDSARYDAWSLVWDAVRRPIVTQLIPIATIVRREINEGVRWSR